MPVCPLSAKLRQLLLLSHEGALDVQGNYQMRTRRIPAILCATLSAVLLSSGSLVLAAKHADMRPRTDSVSQSRPVVSHRLTVQWNIASQPAVKILVRHDGWYRIGQGDLALAGLPAVADPHRLQLWVGGKQQPMAVIAQGNQFNRPWFSIGFYGVGLDLETSDTNVYYLIVGQQAGRRIQTAPRPSVTTAPPLASFSAVAETKDRTRFYGGPVPAGQQHFLGHLLYHDPVNTTIDVPMLDASQRAPLQLTVGIQGGVAGTHAIGVSFNGTAVGTVTSNNTSRADQSLPIPAALAHAGTNNIQLVPSAQDSGYSYFDYARLRYPHLGDAEANRLQFQVPANDLVTVGGFTTPNVRVLDITKPHATPFLTPIVRPNAGRYAITVRAGGAHVTGLRTLLAFGQGEQGVTLERNVPSHLHAATNSADFVIIAYHDFIPSVQSLAKLRQSQGLQVQVVDVDSVFDEFSYGLHDPQALKDFLMYAKAHWKKAPRYVLLMGGGSLDPRNYTGYGNTDLVPAKLIATSITETASDEWYVDFNGDHVPAMAIGRLAVRNVAEANIAIGKIVGYTPGAESNTALLVAGGQHPSDSFNFVNATRDLGRSISSSLNVEDVARADGTVDSVKSKVIAAIDSGPRLVNYVGHGSIRLWEADLLTSEDADALTNGNHLPMFIMMTCLNGYFLDPDPRGKSLAESLIDAPHGGAVAVWSSTGETVPEPQAEINKAFYRLLLAHPSMRLGDLAVQASQATTDPDVRQTWIMFGDPTMTLG